MTTRLLYWIILMIDDKILIGVIDNFKFTEVTWITF